MKKKDWIVMGIILLAAALGWGIIQWVQHKNQPEETQFGYVYHQNTIILAFDIHYDHIYDFDGSYGHMQLEVLDGKWRIINEDCPNHICSSMGWVGPEDLLPIVCVPNEVYVSYQGEQEE